MANIWPVAPCWLRRYLDICLKRTEAGLLHQHLNLVLTLTSNSQIIEHGCHTDQGQSVSSLDSQITMLGDGSMFTEKQTIPTNFWILSHNPAQKL